MKRLKKILMLVMAICVFSCSGLFAHQNKVSAATTTPVDNDFNIQQLAKDFEFITKFYVEDEDLNAFFNVDLGNGNFGYNRILSSNVVFSTDVQMCDVQSVSDLTNGGFYSDFNETYYSLLEGQSVAITVDAGVDVIVFGGYDFSYLDLAKTMFSDEGVPCYFVRSDFTGAIAEDEKNWYVCYIGQSEEERTVILTSDNFIDNMLIEDIVTFKSATYSVSEVARRQEENGEIFYAFCPTLNKTISKNGIVTTMLPYSPVSSLNSCSAVYPEYGKMLGYFNGIYDAFFHKLRKPDYLGNDRRYPSDITDSAIQKQINTAHKVSYGETYDYIANSMSQTTETIYDTDNLPFAGAYGANSVTDKLEQFIRDYCSDNSGRIFKSVEEKYIETIRNGLLTWRGFTEIDHEYINKRLSSANGNSSICSDYDKMYSRATDIHLALNFIEHRISDDDGNIIIKGSKSNYIKLNTAKSVYYVLTDGAKAYVNYKITDANNGLEKTFEELYQESYNDYTFNKGSSNQTGKTDSEVVFNGSSSNSGQKVEDYDLDFSNFSFENFLDNLKRFFENPLKWFQKFGEAIFKGANLIWFVIKVIIAILVGVLLIKCIKAIVRLFKG